MMRKIELSNEAIKHYFGFLDTFGNETKKNLIARLTKSISEETDSNFNLKSCFGAWKDVRSSDEIINEIRNARVERNTVSF